MNDLAVQNNNPMLQVLQNSLYPGASEDAVKMVLGYCKAAGLDPMQKPVHIVPIWDAKRRVMRDVIMPGIGLYRTQASRAGCVGINEPEFGPDITENIGGITITFPSSCGVTVKRRLASGEIAEFSSREFWKENYAVRGGADKSIAPNAMWAKRPYGQLAKCAEAQALRKAFPEIGSQPTSDEMDGKEIEEILVNNPIVVDEKERLETYPDDNFDENLPKWKRVMESGKKTAEEIIATISTKALLTEEQKTAIRSVEVPAQSKNSKEITFAHVATKMQKAKDIDSLDEAADLIGEVSNSVQRGELSEMYQSIRQSLTEE